MISQFLDVGKIVGTHGIRGDLKVECWCDSQQDFCDIKNLYFDKEGKILVKKCSARPHKSAILLKIKDINTIEEADVLRGKILYASREDLNIEPDEFFISDVIGCKVIDESGNNYGVVADVLKNPANDVYEVKTPENKIVLMPGIKDIIIDIDPYKEVVLINPMKGLFDDEN